MGAGAGRAHSLLGGQPHPHDLCTQLRRLPQVRHHVAGGLPAAASTSRGIPAQGKAGHLAGHCAGEQQGATRARGPAWGNSSCRAACSHPFCCPCVTLACMCPRHASQETRFFNIVGNCSHPGSATRRWGCDKAQVRECPGWAAPSKKCVCCSVLGSTQPLPCCTPRNGAVALQHAAHCNDGSINFLLQEARYLQHTLGQDQVVQSGLARAAFEATTDYAVRCCCP